ncbi:MAG: hypothetical protein U1E17_08985 [Geminicoccaceae bacterium]
MLAGEPDRLGGVDRQAANVVAAAACRALRGRDRGLILDDQDAQGSTIVEAPTLVMVQQVPLQGVPLMELARIGPIRRATSVIMMFLGMVFHHRFLLRSPHQSGERNGIVNKPIVRINS